jgi:hypothetical protein
MLTVADINSAPETILRVWYRDGLLLESEAVRERMCMRVEALGLVRNEGGKAMPA